MQLTGLIKGISSIDQVLYGVACMTMSQDRPSNPNVVGEKPVLGKVKQERKI